MLDDGVESKDFWQILSKAFKACNAARSLTKTAKRMSKDPLYRQQYLILQERSSKPGVVM